MRAATLCVFVSCMLTPALSATAKLPPATEITRVLPVETARATAIPKCSVFVDVSEPGGDGSARAPFTTIAAGVEAAEPGAVICVAEGEYPEQLKPGEKYFTLAGGFQSGTEFKVRDSAVHITLAKGSGGSFLRIEDPGATQGQLTAVDGFDISGYSQAIYRDFYVSQRFDVTNNHIHDNTCADETLVGAGVALNNVSGTIKGNVFANNACGRGGALFLNDTTNENAVTVEGNRVDGNSGTEPGSSHGGAIYVFGNTLRIVGNEITNNSVTQWGGGLYVGAYKPGGQPTTATMAWNVYRKNRAGNSGGGFFCDDGATCNSAHEVYDGNCGGNILVDGGGEGSGPTTARFDYITSINALAPGCDAPGDGLFVNTYEAAEADTYTIGNALFWGNGDGKDIVSACDKGCSKIKVSVSRSMLDTSYGDGNIKVTFKDNIAPQNPLFVAPDAFDFRVTEGSPAADVGAFAGGKGADVAPDAPVKRESASELQPAPASQKPSLTKKAAPSENSGAQAAFNDAKELGTLEAWQAFLVSYPDGFLADLARAYIKKLRGDG